MRRSIAQSQPVSGQIPVSTAASIHGAVAAIFNLAMTVCIERRERPGSHLRDEGRAKLPPLPNDCHTAPLASATKADAILRATGADLPRQSRICQAASVDGRYHRYRAAESGPAAQLPQDSK